MKAFQIYLSFHFFYREHLKQNNSIKLINFFLNRMNNLHAKLYL